MVNQSKSANPNDENKPEYPYVELQLDRSVAYEMINDFGTDAFLGVISQYQENMAKNLNLLTESASRNDPGEQLWALQYIRNCSAQLGIAGVAHQCRLVMDNAAPASEFETGLTSEEHQHFETIINLSIDSLRTICTEMQS